MLTDLQNLSKSELINLLLAEQETAQSHAVQLRELQQKLSVKGHEYSPPGVNSIPHLFSELSDSI
jgi:hypothetical protein